MVVRKEKLEEAGGYDESLAYGEDADLRRKLNDLEGKRVGLDDVYIYTGLVSSLGEVFRQGRWYGKSLPQYLRKYPEELPSLLTIALFVSLPLFTAGSFFSKYLLIVSIPQLLIVTLYVLEGLRRTRNPYMLLVPIVKIVRSYAELLGMIEGFFTDDLGRE